MIWFIISYAFILIPIIVEAVSCIIKRCKDVYIYNLTKYLGDICNGNSLKTFGCKEVNR